MHLLRRLSVALLGTLLAISAGAAPPGPPADLEEPEMVRNVREELLDLPYYGVFDLITFQVDEKGVVTLGGYIYEASLKRNAEKSVKKVAGVTGVENKIEVLPASFHDDDLRWGVYWAIYRDSPLSRYGSVADMRWGWRPGFRPWGWGFRRWGAFRQPRWTGRPFWGLEPLGSHAIHIIVKNGEVILAGVVNDQADKDLALIKARSVFGVRKVTNDLEVEPGSG
jgi:hypothetical protein